MCNDSRCGPTNGGTYSPSSFMKPDMSDSSPDDFSSPKDTLPGICAPLLGMPAWGASRHQQPRTTAFRPPSSTAGSSAARLGGGSFEVFQGESQIIHRLGRGGGFGRACDLESCVVDPQVASASSEPQVGFLPRRQQARPPYPYQTTESRRPNHSRAVAWTMSFASGAATGAFRESRPTRMLCARSSSRAMRSS